MCGIAGIVDLTLARQVDRPALERMTASLEHRGPDESGFYVTRGIGCGARRLSIVGIHDSQQPIFNEDRTVVTVFNGELFDYVENRAWLVERGHHVRTSGDTETLVHLWEEFGEDMFPHLNGQFAFALYDLKRRLLILARDRVGICPLHWAQVDNWLIFGSEIKAILASGMVSAAADPRGLNQIFTFFCLPGPRTTFRHIRSVAPGGYLKIQFGGRGDPAAICQQQYWDLDFPDRSDPPDRRTEDELVEQLDTVLGQAIRVRMRADVPVAAYLSGGVDSATMIACSNRLGCPTMKTFTAGINDPKLNESGPAADIARRVGCGQQLVPCDAKLLSAYYPRVVAAADCPVVDPNAAALWALSRAVREAGLKVILTGEGADEALGGYVWFKAHKALRLLGWSGFHPAAEAFRLFLQWRYPRLPKREFALVNQATGGLHAQTLLYHLTSVVRWQLLNPDLRAELDGHRPYDELGFDTEKIRRWHPFNQSLYLGYKTQLVGLLLNHRGDRVSMANSVEARYPFLDEKLIRWCAHVHPRWKLRGLRRDKYVLRRVATRYFPREVAWRRKAMFRSPFMDTFFPAAQTYVQQLFSPESLRRTDYFDSAAVHRLLDRLQRRRRMRSPLDIFDEMAVTTVLGTQLWHHLYLGGGLCELPSWSAPPAANTSVATAP